MATAPEVDIVNQALFLCGNEPVPDLSDATLEQSNAAVKLLRVMQTSRDTVLARHGWVCALQYASLPPASLNGYTNFRYPYVYQLPGDALRVWEIAGVISNGVETCWEPRWQVGTWETDTGAAIIIRALDASDQLNLAYVRRANWAALAVHVRDAIAYDMAARSIYSINGDEVKRKSLAQEAEGKVQLAIGVDGAQEGGQPPLAPSIPAAIRRYAESGGAWEPYGRTWY